MRVDLLKQILAVPSQSHREDQMVEFIRAHVEQGGERLRGRCTVDEHLNVYIVKGNADHLPCVAAHIDTVHPMRPVQIVEQDGVLLGFDEQGERTGTGADDKGGVFICLELLERFENIALALFAQEETGYEGAMNADARFFERVGYVLEFDCPAHGLVSYTSGGVRLFQNGGEFIRAAMPVLGQFGFVCFQHHPFSDVKAVRQRFSMSCLNLSCGYYNWHAHDECVRLADVENSLAMATELIAVLGERRYEYDATAVDDAEPPVEVTELGVPSLVNAQ
jgi:putative aminopeptidase FrvX